MPTIANASHTASSSTRPLLRDAHASGSMSDSRPMVVFRRPWTGAEDLALREAVLKYGTGTGPGSSWSTVSRLVGGGRSNKDCRKRWFHTLDPTLKKGRWTKEEDENIRLAFAQVGASWQGIALHVPGRTAEQVAKRWKDVLSPDLQLDAPWTPEEDSLLRHVYKEYGPSWTLMADSFPGRNGIACRNRFRKLRKTEPHIANEVVPSVWPQAAAPIFSGPDSSFQTSLGEYLEQHATHPEDQSITLEQLAFDMQLDVHDTNQFTSFGPLQSDLYIAPCPGQPLIPWDPTYLPTQQAISGPSLNTESIATDTTDTTGDAGVTLEDWLGDITFDANSDWTSQPQNPRSADLEMGPEAVSGRPSAPSNAEPINNAWSLLVALDTGSENLTLTSAFLRQLLADASRQ